MSNDATKTMTRPAAAPAWLDQCRAILADIKIAHSVFALPFAVLAAMLAAFPGDTAADPIRLTIQFGLIVGAMVAARTAAMIANRLLDHRFDRDNPRTAGRAIPSGRLTVRGAATGLVATSLGFMAICVAFGLALDNWWPSILGGPVLAWICAYAWFKRFTALCHLYLGSSLAISPLAAAIAIDPSALASMPALWLLSAMVLCWVAGFDIIYALQDVDVDREQGLHSMPSRLGVPAAMLVSRALHAVAIGALVAAAILDPRLQIMFGLGVVIVAALLIYEHTTVARWGTTKMALAFFTLNGIVSCVLGILGSIDVIVN